MAQSLSAPNKIIDIYKKLVFMHEEGTDAFFLQTTAVNKDDVKVTTLNNSFVIPNAIEINLIKGPNYDDSKQIDDLLCTIYGNTLEYITEPGYATDVYGASQVNIKDVEFRGVLSGNGFSLPDDLLAEMNVRFDTDTEHKKFIDDLKYYLGFDIGESSVDDELHYHWSRPAWDRLHLTDNDIDTVTQSSDAIMGGNFYVDNFSDAIQKVDKKLYLDLLWLKGIQLKLDEGVSSNNDDFQTSYLNTYLNGTGFDTFYLGGAETWNNDSTLVAGNSNPKIDSFIKAIKILDRRIFNREKEIDGLSTRLNLAIGTSENGLVTTDIWNGIEFHGDMVTNSGNEIDFENSETLLAGQVTENSPKLGDALNRLIDRDERVQGMMDKRLTGTDTYTDDTTAENLQEAFNRLDYIDESLENIRLHSFGAPGEAAYQSANPQGSSPASYNNLTNLLPGGTYCQNVYNLENSFLALDEKIAYIEMRLAGETTTSDVAFLTDVTNKVGNITDGTEGSVELTINKIVDWFKQFTTVDNTGMGQPNTISNYTFDDDVEIGGNHDFLTHGNITLQKSGMDFKIQGDGGYDKFSVNSSSGNTYIKGVAQIDGDLNVGTGPTKFSVTASTGAVTTLSDIQCVNLVCGGDITAVGAMTMDTLEVSQDTDLNGNLNVSGNIVMDGSNQLLTGLTVDQFEPTSAATVGWVSSIAAGRIWGDACEAVETSNIGFTGITAIDGYTLQANDKVLLVGQTTEEENGLYIHSSGNLTRPASGSYSTGSTVKRNLSHYIKNGTSYVDTVYTITHESADEFTVNNSTGDPIEYSLTQALNTFADGNVTQVVNNSMRVNLGDGLTDDNGSGSWTYPGAAHNLKIKLKGTPSLEFDAGNLEVAVDGTWIQKGAAGTGGAITLGSTKQSEHTHATAITDSMDDTYWSDATFLGYIEGIDQELTTTSDVDFNTVTADLTGDVTGDVTGNLSGNATTATSLASTRDISLTGDVSGTVTGDDGSGNLSITTTVANNSHTHDNRYYTESEIDTKLANSGQWDDAYSERKRWDGGSTSLNASTGRTSLGLGGAAVLDVGTGSGDVAQGNHDHDSDYILKSPSNPDSQQTINSPLKVIQGDSTTGTLFTCNSDQDTVVRLSTENSPDLENNVFLAIKGKDTNSQGDMGIVWEHGINVATKENYRIIARNEPNNKLEIQATTDNLGGLTNPTFNTALAFKGDAQEMEFNSNWSVTMDSIVSGAGIEDVTIVDGGAKLTTENAVFDFVESRIGTGTTFTLETAEGSMSTGINNKLPTVGAVVDYVTNNTPATGVEKLKAVSPLSITGGTPEGSDFYSGDVTIEWSYAGSSVPGVVFTPGDDSGAAVGNFTWSVGGNDDPQYQIYENNGSNATISIDWDSEDVGGTWKLLVTYSSNSGQVGIDWDSHTDQYTPYSMWGSAWLTPPGAGRSNMADLIVITKLKSNVCVVSLVSPLEHMGDIA